jgi:iron complex transport system ATP-binding protein
MGLDGAPAAGIPALEARGVGYTVGGARLLADVSLAVRPGELVALVGPNGAGKSTLLRVLAGDLDPTEGGVLLDGKPLGSYRAAALARRRAVMPQQTILQFAFTVREVVEMGRAARPNSDSEAHRAAVDASLARTDASALAGRTYPTLSGGEQQRVTLARVLAQEAPLLLLDEPTNSLDLRHQELVLQTARSAAADGAAVLAVLHDLNLAAAYADRVALLSGGRLAACGPPWEVFTEALLSEIFQHPIAVCRHPLRDCPLVLPAPELAARPLASTRRGSAAG